MNDLSNPEVKPPSENNPWPLFPEKKITSRLPPASVGFSRRSLAFLVDLVLVEWVAVFFTLIGLYAREAALGGGTAGIFWEGLEQWGLLHSRSWTLVFLGYFSFFGFYGGQTPGKMLFRFRVVMKNGAAVPFPRALLRTLGYFLDFFSLGLGFLAAAFSPSGRALHDLLAGTRVEKDAVDG